MPMSFFMTWGNIWGNKLHGSVISDQPPLSGPGGMLV
jgi:hypothetical protein